MFFFKLLYDLFNSFHHISNSFHYTFINKHDQHIFTNAYVSHAFHFISSLFVIEFLEYMRNNLMQNVLFIKNKYHLLTKFILNFNFIEILLKIMMIFFLTNMKKHLNEKYLDVIYENMINFFFSFQNYLLYSRLTYL